MSLPPPETDHSEPQPRAARESGLAQAPAGAAWAGRRRRGIRGARRVDVAIGVLVGVLVVVFVPGIALAGIGAAVVLVLVGLSLLFRRMRARHAGRSRRRRR